MGYDLFWKKLTEDIQAVAAKPLLELAGTGRILIENHKGVCGYERDRIAVRMAYGQLEIAGEDLELTQITAQQLVITGIIQSITVFRGEDT